MPSKSVFFVKGRVRALGAGVAAGIAVLLAAPPSQAQSDWTGCADEGEMCRVNGQALVRFGTDGRYTFRVANGRVMCDTESFGDPAPQQKKGCDVSYGWRADERYRGWREAGARGRDGWILCANEGELCRVPGPARVRYGANGRYAFANVDDAVACDNRAFGDPLAGIAKQCEYLVGSNGGGGRGGPDYDGRQAPTSLTWDNCAPEGRRCNVRSDTIVRYGGARRYRYAEVSGSIACSNDAFGGDPAPNQPKRCEALRMGR